MVRPRLLIPLIAVWFAGLLLSFHFLVEEPFPPGPLARILWDIVLLSVIGAAAWGFGGALLMALRVPARPAMERALLATGAGLGALALAIFALAAAGALYRGAVLGVLLAGCGLATIAGLRPGRAAVPPRPEDARAARTGWGPMEIGMAGLAVIAGLATLGAALAPPEFYDALIYHLAVPDLYIRHHGMVPVEGNYYAHFPANMGMLYAAGLLVGGPELAQTIHWLCGALAAAALIALARRHTDRPTALLACALFCFTPGVMLVSTYAIADLGVTLFATLGFACVLSLWEEGDWRWLALAGLFAGLALGTKYTAALVAVAPAAAAIAVRPGPGGVRGRATRALREVATFGAVAALMASPWMARNLIFTGNPLAPYLSSNVTGSPDITEELQRRLPDGAGPLGLAAHYLAAPWSASMKRLGAGGYLGPVFLMLAVALPFLRGLPRAVTPVATMAGVGFVLWAMTSQVTRYLFPVLPLIALLAAVAATRLPKSLSIPTVGWCISYNLFLFVFLIETIGSYRVVSGAESREEYLTRRVSYYPAMTYLAASPPGTRVLFVGEGRTFYCPRDCVASTPLDVPMLDRFAAGTTDEQALVEKLRANGFTHLLVSGPELRRTQGVGADEVMRAHFPSGSPRLLFERQDVRVYGLSDGDEARSIQRQDVSRAN